jgi:predicted SPOUT superfamily RNA methylase MTH1
MISFVREGSKVTIRVTGQSPIADKIYPFSYEAGTEGYALLLRQNLADALWQAIKKAREEEYEKGWKAAKAKKRKETYFAGWFK